MGERGKRRRDADERLCQTTTATWKQEGHNKRGGGGEKRGKGPLPISFLFIKRRRGGEKTVKKPLPGKNAKVELIREKKEQPYLAFLSKIHLLDRKRKEKEKVSPPCCFAARERVDERGGRSS